MKKQLYVYFSKLAVCDLATKRPPKTEEVCQNERGSLEEVCLGKLPFGTGRLGEVSRKLPLFRFDFVVNFCPRSQVVFAHEVKMKQISFAFEVKLQSQKAKCKAKKQSAAAYLSFAAVVRFCPRSQS